MSELRTSPLDPENNSGAGAVVGGAAGGIAGAAAAGALAGGLTGPAGAAVGAVVGAVAGAVTGRSATPDPGAEDTYWRQNFASRPYASGATYDEYQPAYQYGVDAYSRHPERAFNDVEPELGREWAGVRGPSSLGWDQAKHATRDAWHRVSNAAERAIPGDSDKDGR